MRRPVSSSACVLACLIVCSSSSSSPAAPPWNDVIDGPLPRWRDGGTPPADPGRPLQPFSLHLGGVADAPTSGELVSPPEYGPTEGVLFRYSSGAWSEVVTDCVAALTGDPAHDEVAYVVVSSISQSSIASSQFAAAGADLDKVQFIYLPTDSIWLRDYGPHFVWQSGTRVVADSHYYPTRPYDNFIPTLLSEDYLRIPAYAMGLYYSGGNFQTGPDASGYVTSLIHEDNAGFGDDFIAELYQTYQGIETLHVFPRLPGSVDATGHIDMWMYIVDEDTVIISEFLPGSNQTAIDITEAATAYMETLGFEVIRVPDHNGYHPLDSYCHFTYTNAFRVNDRIFIPSYGEGNPTHLARDQEALAAYQAAAPDAEIIPVNSYDIIYAAGAIHCIVMQVPRYTATTPDVHVIAPDDGTLLVSGTEHEIRWAATDDVLVWTADLSYSLDGGVAFPYLIAAGEASDGRYTWTVPDVLSDAMVLKVEVVDGDGHTAEATSSGLLEIRPAATKTYDFSTGSGVDRWAWGHQTFSFSSVDGVRYPVSSELTESAYAQIAVSDATGGDTDTNRYISPFPSSGRESTHVFELTILEDPSAILTLDVLWEGYGDDCTQAELYAWDHVQGNWCDGISQFGENRYVDNFAGNRDRTVRGHIGSDVERLIDADGRLTLLAYAERANDRTFHDYLSVTVAYQYPGDVNHDGFVNVEDLLQVILAWGACPALPAPCPGDVSGDGAVNVEDLLQVILSWGSGS